MWLFPQFKTGAFYFDMFGYSSILFGAVVDVIVWLVGFVGFMIFNATFNKISVILWRSVLLVEETGGNHRPAVSHKQTDSMVVGFITTYAISADHSCEFESLSWRGWLDITFGEVWQWLAACLWFLWVLWFPPPIKLTTAIELKYC